MDSHHVHLPKDANDAPSFIYPLSRFARMLVDFKWLCNHHHEAVTTSSPSLLGAGNIVQI